MTMPKQQTTPRVPAAAGAGPAAGVRLADVAVRFRGKKRDVTALSDVSLDVAPGEFVAIVGPSGCGKSTLLKLVAGLLTASSGDVLLGGERVTGPRHDIGYVFQRAALLEWRSALRNILLQAEIRRMEPAVARARADELIRMTGLGGFEDAYPHELSGGMQQRVALCRALLHEPPVLLMDEPFGALDALTREQMNTELNRIWRTTGTTVLLVTHSISEAVYLADRVVVMSPRPGTVTEIIEVGLPAERDYSETLGRPEFRAAAAHIRDLLGAVSAHD
ncbi:ABC transporter ATP-binding protein [Streptomyces sp. TSRI0445]|uniref:ABC transporter, ATP-binding protein (Cluster 1, maltose/g3p/polyamine/iron) ABC transporter, ATP-binding protein (Cluster 10, nitrate/sulfonate/bicarbonate) n=1 Tax=Streptomyces globisporus TaxID=1908 RepID=A0ABM9GYL5_STRGL|nr:MULTISPECIES: ABC transporter ATP-binding protein [Streptomyces]PPA38744.1 ABC transporter ATP-binding protein [Streptomyces griseus]RAN16166.1 ABC transporter ATP-binding protein [Streptomyces badius]AWL84959.1 ABC transporter ATP-binding protein [Streptomyces globisporus]OKI68217.1 ABC transporter ATP-binding protein [Streptomyces sp. TSRI0445]RAN24023.1 ABC transporter ATP-binding protein [Streptomyces badius]